MSCSKIPKTDRELSTRLGRGLNNKNTSTVPQVGEIRVASLVFDIEPVVLKNRFTRASNEQIMLNGLQICNYLIKDVDLFDHDPTGRTDTSRVIRIITSNTNKMIRKIKL